MTRIRTHLSPHPAFLESVRKLNAWGARVLYEPEKYPVRNQIPIEVVLAEVEQLITKKQ